jgi:phospholipase/carboxylesterase
VVFLHGYGADGADLLGLADVLGPHLPDTAFVAPDAPEPCIGNPFGRQWFPIPWLDGSSEAAARQGLLAAAADLDAFLDARLADEGLPAAALALFGFSQGAMIALQVAPRRAEPVAGVVACSGRLLAPERLAAEAVSKPPVLLMHGDADPVVPFADMAVAGRALSAAGFETYGHVMQGAGHGIAPDGLGATLGFLKDRLPA